MPHDYPGRCLAARLAIAKARKASYLQKWTSKAGISLRINHIQDCTAVAAGPIAKHG